MLRCLDGASMAFKDVLGAIFRVMASEDDINARTIAANVIQQLRGLPLKQWKVIDEELNGLQTLISVFKHPCPKALSSAVRDTLEFIFHSCADIEVADFLLPRLCALGLVDSLLSLMETEWVLTEAETGLGVGYERRPVLEDCVHILYKVWPRVEISVELQAATEVLRRASVHLTDKGSASSKMKTLREIRPLSQKQAEKLKRGSVVRLRGIQDPERCCFNNRFADVTEKLCLSLCRWGKVSVSVRPSTVSSGKKGGQWQSECPVLILPRENLLGSHRFVLHQEGKGLRHGLNSWFLFAGTCAYPACSNAPELMDGREGCNWAEKNLKKCKACQHAQYCSGVCQKLHWKTQHKKECALLKSWRDGGGDL